jgi:hypothetical protein
MNKIHQLLLALVCLVGTTVRAMEIDITGLDKGAVLRALFRHATAPGSGHFQYKETDTLSDAEIRDVLETGFADYIKGRYMKIRITPTTSVIDVERYNNVNGEHAAQDAIQDAIDELKKNSAS